MWYGTAHNAMIEFGQLDTDASPLDVFGSVPIPLAALANLLERLIVVRAVRSSGEHGIGVHVDIRLV